MMYSSHEFCGVLTPFHRTVVTLSIPVFVFSVCLCLSRKIISPIDFVSRTNIIWNWKVDTKIVVL